MQQQQQQQQHKGKDESDLDPKFASYPASLQVDENSSTRFDCAVVGTSPITGYLLFSYRIIDGYLLIANFCACVCVFLIVKWFKNENDELSESTNKRIKLLSEPETGKHSLQIANISSSDNGQYHALASNATGEVVAAFSLLVNVRLDNQ